MKCRLLGLDYRQDNKTQTKPSDSRCTLQYLTKGTVRHRSEPLFTNCKYGASFWIRFYRPIFSYMKVSVFELKILVWPNDNFANCVCKLFTWNLLLYLFVQCPGYSIFNIFDVLAWHEWFVKGVISSSVKSHLFTFQLILFHRNERTVLSFP